MIHSVLDKQFFDSICTHWLLNKFRHAILNAFSGNHSIIISCKSNYVWLFDSFFGTHLIDLLTCFETVHNWHTAVHKDNFEGISIPTRLAASIDLFLKLIKWQLSSINSNWVNLKFKFDHSLHGLKIKHVIINNHHLRLSWHSLNLR